MLAVVDSRGQGQWAKKSMAVGENATTKHLTASNDENGK